MPISVNLLFHMHHESEEARPTTRAYKEVLALTQQADALPIGCVWLAEHHLLPTRGRLPAPLLFAVAAARETRRVRIGPCVLVLPLHAPLDLAEQVAVADVLTEGRLAVGVGSGGNEEESRAFGIRADERRARFAEGLDVLSGLLRAKPYSYHGTYYQLPEVTLVPRPLQSLEDMLWVAAGSASSATLAGSSRGHLLLARGVSMPELREQIAAYQAAREVLGLDPLSTRIQVTRGVYVAPTEEQAWREAAEGIGGYLRATGREVSGEDLREAARRGHFIIGSPDNCAAQMQALAEELPITDLACDIFLYGMDYALLSRSLDLLGRVVEMVGGSQA